MLNNDKNKRLSVNSLLFSWLTNNSFLYDIYPIMNTLLDDNDNRKAFLIKMENIMVISEEILIVFKNNEKNDISKFVLNYQELLFKMYQYQVIQEPEENDNKSQNTLIKNNSTSSIEVTTRKEIFDLIDEVESCYQKISKNNGFEKMKKEISLFKLNNI